MSETFSRWLLRQVQRRDPVGDLATDYTADRKDNCARYIQSVDGLRTHMEDIHGADELALAALDQAQDEWLETVDAG